MFEEQQTCFVTSDGFMLCNFVVRKGVEVRSKSGKWLKFRAPWGARKRKSPEEASSSDP